MLDTEIKINLFLMQYCRMLMADIADGERMAQAAPRRRTTPPGYSATWRSRPILP